MQVYAPGFRNPYDVRDRQAAARCTPSTTAATPAGATCPGERRGPAGTAPTPSTSRARPSATACTWSTGPGYYGGHPNPTRANLANTFNAQPAVARDDGQPRRVRLSCTWRLRTARSTTFAASTNGLTEYTAVELRRRDEGRPAHRQLRQQDLPHQAERARDTAVVQAEPCSANVGSLPARRHRPGRRGTLPGHDLGGRLRRRQAIDRLRAQRLRRPAAAACTGADDPTLDEDGDGYNNADEIDNGTNPCSAADVPPDCDGDFLSDLNDPDDDNDGLPDTADPFAIDADNGKTTSLPVSYTWDNDAPNTGGLLNLGFTGLMTNGSANYETLYDPAKMTAGGAAGVVTVDAVPEGDAWGDQRHAEVRLPVRRQMPATTGTFTVHTRIQAPFAGMTPEDNQSMGLFIGNGDQDNYVKLITHANDGAGGVVFAKEVDGTFVRDRPQATESLPGPDAVDLFLTVDPDAKTVEPSYVVTTNGEPGPVQAIGGPEPIPTGWFGGSTGLAVGIISTSVGPGPAFPATWEFIEETPESQ